jgi:two-component system, chemotaxis family, response regulator Rcp1
MPMNRGKIIDILIVDDNPGDVRLTMEVFKESKIHNQLHVAQDGEEAIQFLRQLGSFRNAPMPDLILLDWNLPRMNGHEVLAEIKADPVLRRIPVVVLTSSEAEEDMVRAYDNYANCFVTKPLNLDQFIKVVQTIQDFWFTIVKQPGRLQA